MFYAYVTLMSLLCHPLLWHYAPNKSTNQILCFNWNFDWQFLNTYKFIFFLFVKFNKLCNSLYLDMKNVKENLAQYFPKLVHVTRVYM